MQYDRVSIVLVELLIFHSDNLYECEFILTFSIEAFKKSENLVKCFIQFSLLERHCYAGTVDWSWRRPYRHNNSYYYHYDYYCGCIENVSTIFLHSIDPLKPWLTNRSKHLVDYMINSILFVIYLNERLCTDQLCWMSVHHNWTKSQSKRDSEQLSCAYAYCNCYDRLYKWIFVSRKNWQDILKGEKH